MATASLNSSVRLHANAGTKRRLTKLLRRLSAAIDRCLYRLLAALHQSRRRQAARFIAENRIRCKT